MEPKEVLDALNAWYCALKTDENVYNGADIDAYRAAAARVSRRAFELANSTAFLQVLHILRELSPSDTLGTSP